MSFYDESEDILTKKLLAKFQVIPILHLQVIHDYMHWHCSIEYCIKLSLVDETLWKIALIISPWNDFYLIPLGKCVL